MSDAAQKPLVLVVEDEPQMRKFVRIALESHDYRVVEANTGAEAVQRATDYTPDAVLLDLGLPDMDGLEVTRRLREWSTVPILVISARGQEESKVQVLDGGADDYLTKPFGVGELLARVRAASRRRRDLGLSAGAIFEFGDVKVDLSLRLVHKGDNPVHLTPIEYRLLSLLVANAGKVMTHRQILREVWGPSHAEDGHYVRVYMGHLRQKLEDDPAQPKYIVTETAVGYRLVQTPSS